MNIGWFCEGGRLHGASLQELESKSSQTPEGLYWPRVGQGSEDPDIQKP